MNIAHMFTTTTLALSSVLLPFSPCYAARIYNNMSVPITVDGSFGTNVVIESGQRSDSLSWNSSPQVSVTGANRQLCYINFGPHAEIQGGNYMIVTPIVGGTSCVVCDSEHNPIAGSGQCN
jgi:hypothetical protein